jgi:DNA primase
MRLPTTTPRTKKMENKVNLLLAQLKKVQQKGKGQWMACCPAHEDKSPSLAIKENHDGRILVKCFAGCGAADVVHAVGLTLADLFPDGNQHEMRPFAFAQVERRKQAQEADRLQKERLILAITEADRKAGKRLSQKDLDRELQAYKTLRAAGIDV